MQGRARGRKGECKTYHINPYHHITMEFGGYFLNVAKKPTRARARKGEAQGVLSYQKVKGVFDNPQNSRTRNAAFLFRLTRKERTERICATDAQLACAYIGFTVQSQRTLRCHCHQSSFLPFGNI